MGGGRDLQEGRLGGPRGVLHDPGEAGDGEALVGGVEVSGLRTRPPCDEGGEGFPARHARPDLRRRHAEEKEIEARWDLAHRHQPRMQSVILTFPCIFSDFVLFLLDFFVLYCIYFRAR